MYCEVCGLPLIKSKERDYLVKAYDLCTGKKVIGYKEYLVCPKRGWRNLWGHTKVYTGFIYEEVS